MVVRKNCLSCILFIWLKLCPIFGIGAVLSIKCNHTKNLDSHEIKYSLFYTITILITVTATLTVFLFDLKYFVEGNSYTIITTFKFVTDMILVINTIHFQISYLILTSKRMLEYKGLIEVLTNGHVYGLNTFLSVHYIKKIRKYSILILVTAILFVTSYTVVNLIYIQSDDKFVYIKTVVTIYSFCIDLLNLTILSSTFLVYNKIVKVVYEEIIKMMVVRRKYEFRDFLIFLRKFRRLHSIIYFNLCQLNHCLNPTALVWFTLTSTTLILNVYITIAAFIHNTGSTFDMTYYIVQIRIVLLLSLMTPALCILDGLTKSVRYFLYIYNLVYQLV